jgi:hypothetical protein
LYPKWRGRAPVIGRNRKSASSCFSICAARRSSPKSWIDQETGLPIPERAGVLRHFIRVSEKVVWADRPEELMQQMKLPQDLPAGVEPPRPISVTFIPAKVFDNPALLRVNPEYPARQRQTRRGDRR